MSLLPEQMRALAYARKRGTDAPLHDIVVRVSGTFSEFEALVDGVPSECPFRRKWTVVPSESGQQSERSDALVTLS